MLLKNIICNIFSLSAELFYLKIEPVLQKESNLTNNSELVTQHIYHLVRYDFVMKLFYPRLGFKNIFLRSREHMQQ